MPFRRVLWFCLAMLHSLCGCASSHGQRGQAWPQLMPAPPAVLAGLEASGGQPGPLAFLAIGLCLGCLPVLCLLWLRGGPRCPRLARLRPGGAPAMTLRLRAVLRELDGILSASQRQAKSERPPPRSRRRF
jgi:hypothetical protein